MKMTKQEYDKQYHKERYKLKKEELKKKSKNYYENNKEKILDRKSKYYSHNREKIIKNTVERSAKKYKSNLYFNLETRIRINFNNSLKNFSKNGKIQSINKYGINIDSIIEHLGEFPKDGKKYHVDHIFPISAFDLNNPKHIKLCWHQNNLRWLEASENLSKHDKYDAKEFLKYINETKL